MAPGEPGVVPGRGEAIRTSRCEDLLGLGSQRGFRNRKREKRFLLHGVADWVSYRERASDEAGGALILSIDQIASRKINSKIRFELAICSH